MPDRPGPRFEPGALVDTHAHLASPEFEADLPGVLARARAAGVGGIVAVGTTAADSEQVIAIARRFEGVRATVAIHPNHAAEAAPGDWERIPLLAAGPEVVAIGETGLDRHWDFTPFALQQDYFDRHLDLAESLNLPVVIHCRNSEDDIIAQLSRRGRPVRGVLHSFTGRHDHARAFLDLGLFVSFAGQITFTNRSLDPLREVAAALPLDRLLVETDCPYLSPHPHRGQTNEPARVALTAARLAEIRQVSPEHLAAATTANARSLFGPTPVVQKLTNS